MKITSKSMTLMIFVMIFGGIALTTAANIWQDGSSKTPRTLTQGEAAGQYDPADIRGSYTFGEVSTYFNIPLETLQKAFRVPPGKDIAGTSLKELADFAPEMSPHAVGLFAAFYNGLPFDPGEEAYLTSDVASILIQRGKMTPEQRAYLDAHTITSAGAQEAQTAPAVAPSLITPTKNETMSGAKTITGTTTFQDLLDWGLSRETIAQIIGSPIDDPSLTVRDYFSDKGLEFKSYKGQLQAELDRIQ